MGIKREDGTIEDRCLDNLRPGTPFFVFTAPDRRAIAHIRGWFAEAKNTLTKEHADEAVAQINAMLDWQQAHPDLVKNPD